MSDVIVVATSAVAVIPDANPTTPVPVPIQSQGQVTGPSANTDGFVPQWNGKDSGTLKDGLPIGGPGGIVLLDSFGRYPPNDASQVMNSPGWSTGDVKLTLKSVADVGWVLFDDGTIGSPLSAATTLADPTAHDLFALLYANCADADVPILTQLGNATSRASQGSAASAWAANCRLTLPKVLGRALASAGSGATLTARPLGSAIGTETHVLSIAELPAHKHTGSDHGIIGSDVTGGVYANAVGAGAGTVPIGANESTDNAGSGTAHTIMQPSSFLNVMVKL